LLLSYFPQLTIKVISECENLLVSLFSFTAHCSLVMFVLEKLVLMKEVIVERFCENPVYFFSQVNLGHLKLVQRVGGSSILVVLVNHRSQQVQVRARELTETLVDESADLWVRLLVLIDHILNKVLTIFEVFNQLG